MKRRQGWEDGAGTLSQRGRGRCSSLSFFCLCNRSSLSMLSCGSTGPEGDASRHNCLISDSWGSVRADGRARQALSFLSPSSLLPPSQLISEMLARQERLRLSHALLEDSRNCLRLPTWRGTRPRVSTPFVTDVLLGTHCLMLRPVVTLLLF